MSQTLDGMTAAETATERIVTAVATAEGRDVTDLDPLYDVIDADALETLLGSGFDGTVSFAYHGYRVTIDGDGDVALEGTVAADGAVDRSPDARQ